MLPEIFIAKSKGREEETDKLDLDVDELVDHTVAMDSEGEVGDRSIPLRGQGEKDSGPRSPTDSDLCDTIS